MSAVILLPWPSPKLSPNARLHHMAKARAVQKARGDARLLALGKRPDFPESGPIPVRITFCPPDRRRRDRDNMISSLKAAVDGIAECFGVDDARFVPTYAVGEPVKGGCVEVSFL
jgi:crossover junction endodeoxyribonuclease RusA